MDISLLLIILVCALDVAVLHMSYAQKALWETEFYIR